MTFSFFCWSLVCFLLGSWWTWVVLTVILPGRNKQQAREPVIPPPQRRKVPQPIQPILSPLLQVKPAIADEMPLDIPLRAVPADDILLPLINGAVQACIHETWQRPIGCTFSYACLDVNQIVGRVVTALGGTWGGDEANEDYMYRLRIALYRLVNMNEIKNSLIAAGWYIIDENGGWRLYKASDCDSGGTIEQATKEYAEMLRIRKNSYSGY